MYNFGKKLALLCVTMSLLGTFSACNGAKAGAETAPSTSFAEEIPAQVETTAAPEPTTIPTEPPRPWLDNVLMEAPNLFPEPLYLFGHPSVTRQQVSSVTFLDTLADMPEDAWDVSKAQDGGVMAWLVPNGRLYDLFIAGEGGVSAPPESWYLFGNYENATAFHFDGNFHTENVEIMEWMFGYTLRLESLDLSTWDTSNVVNMGRMFDNCRKLAQVDLSSFDTSRVTDMRGMFQGCDGLKGLDLSSFDTSNVTDMGGMFESSHNLAALDLSQFDTSKVENMEAMFAWTPALRELELGQWETGSVSSYKDFMRGSGAPQAGSWQSLFQKEE